jgi:hypothetical protein
MGPIQSLRVLLAIKAMHTRPAQHLVPPLRTAKPRPMPRLVTHEAGNNPAQSAKKANYQKTSCNCDSATN